MAKNSRQTSSKAASAASKVLRNPRSGAAAKTAAASALSQKGKGKMCALRKAFTRTMTRAFPGVRPASQGLS